METADEERMKIGKQLKGNVEGFLVVFFNMYAWELKHVYWLETGTSRQKG